MGDSARTDTHRPIFVTLAQRNSIASVINAKGRPGVAARMAAEALVAAWDAAPADPTEAIEDALEYGEFTGDVIAAAYIAVRALGYKAAS